MADQKGEGGSYLTVWGRTFEEPWKRLLHEVANLSAEDAGSARVVVGGGSSVAAEAPATEHAEPGPPASPCWKLPPRNPGEHRD